MEGGKGKQTVVIGKWVKKELTGDVESSSDDDDYDSEFQHFLEDDSEVRRKKKLVISASFGGGRRKGSSTSSGGMTRCCQADKCTADLSDAKPYHRRHKVCEYHSKAQLVLLAGMRQRFCQQCSRFHEVSEFDDMKRSCRMRLAGHNERRRKNAAAGAGAGAIAAIEEEEEEGELQDIMCGQVGDHNRARIKTPTIQENSTYKHFQIR